MNDMVFLFDIGNVLIDFSFIGLQERMAENAGVPLSRVQSEWSHPDHKDVETGKLDEQSYFSRFCRRVGLTWTFAQWIDQWARIYTPNRFGQGLLQELRTEGHPTGLLSNLGPHHVTAIEEGFPGFFNLADHHFFSFELGLHKPDPAIYRAVSQKLDRRPEQCVFLDDMQENVEGARVVGMHAMPLTPQNHEEVEHFVRSLT